MTQEILKQMFDDVAWKEFGAEPVTGAIDHVTVKCNLCNRIMENEKANFYANIIF